MIALSMATTGSHTSSGSMSNSFQLLRFAHHGDIEPLARVEALRATNPSPVFGPSVLKVANHDLKERPSSVLQTELQDTLV